MVVSSYGKARSKAFQHSGLTIFAETVCMPIDVNSDTFEKEVVQSEQPVLVDFWGPQCVPCLALMPQIEKLEQTYGDKIKITKIDASKNRRLCLQLKVLGLPTFLFYKKGEGVGRLTGQNLKIQDIEEGVKKII